MKNKGVVVSAVLGVLASGCLDAEAWERAQKVGSSGRANAAARELEEKIGTNVPPWDVHVIRGRSGEDVIQATPRDKREGGAIPGDDHERGAVLLDGSAGSTRAFENEVRRGRLSLVDMLAIADEIERQDYRLGAPPAPGEAREGPSRRARPLGSATEVAVARRVHDDLLRYVRERVAAGQCHDTCEGNYAACSSAGTRAFAGGVPCRIGKDSTTGEYTRRYGRGWCAEAFCPALRSVVEGWKDGP